MLFFTWNKNSQLIVLEKRKTSGNEPRCAQPSAKPLPTDRMNRRRQNNHKRKKVMVKLASKCAVRLITCRLLIFRMQSSLTLASCELISLHFFCSLRELYHISLFVFDAPFACVHVHVFLICASTTSYY